MATLLECRYGRRFGNPWTFVEYAPAENLGLDFTACAKQPPRQTPRPQGDPAKHPHPARSRGRKAAIIRSREATAANSRGWQPTEPSTNNSSSREAAAETIMRQRNNLPPLRGSMIRVPIGLRADTRS